MLNLCGQCLLELFDDLNLLILYGRRSKNDANGEFTFVGVQGASLVIDYSAVLLCMFPLIVFEVFDKPFSDYLQILIVLHKLCCYEDEGNIYGFSLN